MLFVYTCTCILDADIICRIYATLNIFAVYSLKRISKRSCIFICNIYINNEGLYGDFCA